jgi:hypothetical protein
MKYLLVICLLIAGCSAVKRVLKDPAKVEVVGREWEKKNPCVNDSFVAILSDTLIKFDTTYKFKFDTINKIDIVKVIDTVLINKTIKIRDTFKVFINDNRRLTIALDSVNYYKGLSAYFKVQFEQQTAQTKEQKHRGNMWMLKFWLLFILMLLIFVLYLKFNK